MYVIGFISKALLVLTLVALLPALSVTFVHKYHVPTSVISVLLISELFVKVVHVVGSVVFDVKDGKMPKLGSLEYLLKAGNLVKGGFTGVSLNNVIDVLVPLKTGNFYEIYGKMTVKNGETNDVEISSRGNDLSLFILKILNKKSKSILICEIFLNFN